MVSDPLTVSKLWFRRKSTEYLSAMLLACPNCATTYEVKASVIGEKGRSLRCARCHNVWFATQSQELAAGASSSHAVKPDMSSAAVRSTSPATDDVISAHAQASIGEAPTSSSLSEVAKRDIESPPLAPALPPGGISMSVEGEDIETFARRQSQKTAKRNQNIRDQFGAPAVIAILGVIAAAIIAWRVIIVQHAPQLASFYASIGLPVNLRQLVFNDVRTTRETRDGVPALVIDGKVTSTGKFAVDVPRIRFGLRNRAGQEIYAWSAQADQTILPAGDTLSFHTRLASPPIEGHDVVVRFLTKRDPIDETR